jgi:hypothetical protein
MGGFPLAGEGKVKMGQSGKYNPFFEKWVAFEVQNPVILLTKCLFVVKCGNNIYIFGL